MWESSAKQAPKLATSNSYGGQRTTHNLKSKLLSLQRATAMVHSALHITSKNLQNPKSRLIPFYTYTTSFFVHSHHVSVLNLIYTYTQLNVNVPLTFYTMCKYK